jgi:hypothetical protein
MKHNVGSYDAAIRFVLGCVILFIGLKLKSWWGLVGFAPLLTSACAFCPLYWVFRIDTTWTDKNPAK